MQEWRKMQIIGDQLESRCIGTPGREPIGLRNLFIYLM
jgi:hypothetical protein